MIARLEELRCHMPYVVRPLSNALEHPGKAATRLGLRVVIDAKGAVGGVGPGHKS